VSTMAGLEDTGAPPVDEDADLLPGLVGTIVRALDARIDGAADYRWRQSIALAQAMACHYWAETGSGGLVGRMVESVLGQMDIHGREFDAALKARDQAAMDEALARIGGFSAALAVLCTLPRVPSTTASYIAQAMDPDCRAGKHGSCVSGGMCVCACHAETAP
jgi:hypothetical protein